MKAYRGNLEVPDNKSILNLLAVLRVSTVARSDVVVRAQSIQSIYQSTASPSSVGLYKKRL